MYCGLFVRPWLVTTPREYGWSDTMLTSGVVSLPHRRDSSSDSSMR